jgi:hypothetical protein
MDPKREINYDSLINPYSDGAMEEYIEAKAGWVIEGEISKLKENLDKDFNKRKELTQPKPQTDQEVLQQNQSVLQSIEKDWNEAILTLITNALRPVIYLTIKELNEKMKDYGEAIISGGEAYNIIVEQREKMVTSDIDTKVVPKPGITRDPYCFFNFLHLFWYEYLEQIIDWLNDNYESIYKTYLVPLSGEPLIRNSQVEFYTPEDVAKGHLPFKKRLTIIPKKTKGTPPVLFDIYLYAIDFYFKKSAKIAGDFGANNEFEYIQQIEVEDNPYVAGILDLPIMREGFLGYDIVDDPAEVTITNKDIIGTNKDTHLKDIIIPKQVQPQVPTLPVYAWTGEMYTGIEMKDGKVPVLNFDRPLWFGSRKTAMLYSMPMKGRLSQSKIGKVYKFVPKTERGPLYLVDITDQRFIDMFTENILDIYGFQNLDELKRIELDVQDINKNPYKTLLRILSCIGKLNLIVQKEVYDRFIPQKLDYYENNFTEYCLDKVVVSAQRFSERECDWELGWFLQTMIPPVNDQALDGYIGKRVDSCWHGGSFHAEICLFHVGVDNMKAKIGELPTEKISITKYREFRKSDYNIDDDILILNQTANNKFIQDPDSAMPSVAHEPISIELNPKRTRDNIVQKLAKRPKRPKQQGGYPDTDDTDVVNSKNRDTPQRNCGKKKDQASKPPGDQSQPKPAGDQSQPKPAGDQSQPKPAGDQSQPKPAGDQSQPKPAGDQSQPKSQPKPAGDQAPIPPSILPSVTPDQKEMVQNFIDEIDKITADKENNYLFGDNSEDFQDEDEQISHKLSEYDTKLIQAKRRHYFGEEKENDYDLWLTAFETQLLDDLSKIHKKNWCALKNLEK